MALHRLIEVYEARSVACRTLVELFALTEAASRDLGFEWLALVHPLWFRTPGPHLVRLDNFGAFAELYIARGFYHHDPAHLACQRTNTAFAWSELDRLVPMGTAQQAIMASAARHGLCSGLSVPLGVIGEPLGCCSFATARADLPSRWQCRAAAFIAGVGFHEARRLTGYPAALPPVSGLSPRKLEVLRFAAMGKTDPEIAMILGLSRTTIETYMAQLRRALDVYTRTQLCVAALRLGFIGMDDAVRSA